jgi:hypothetical protein
MLRSNTSLEVIVFSQITTDVDLICFKISGHGPCMIADQGPLQKATDTTGDFGNVWDILAARKGDVANWGARSWGQGVIRVLTGGYTSVNVNIIIEMTCKW